MSFYKGIANEDIVCLDRLEQTTVSLLDYAKQDVT